ncbi:MAG: PilZ domain-containing protein [Burkholderiales bacterium]
MNGNEYAEHLQELSRQLVEAAEKRAVLRVELAALKKARKTSRVDEKRKKIKLEVQRLSRTVEEIMAEIAQPIPRKMERWTGVIPVTLRVEARGRRYEHVASTLDLSDHGLRILTTTSLTPGQTLEVYSDRARIGNCRVVWVTGAGSDRPSEVGLEILK